MKTLLLLLTVTSPPLSVVYVTELQLYTLYVQKCKLTIFKCIHVLNYVENKCEITKQSYHNINFWASN